MNRKHRLHRLKTRITQILLFIITVFSQISVFAGIGVDPVTVEVVVPKGSEKTGVFKIRNTGLNAVNIRVSPEKWMDREREIGTWLKLEPMELMLNSGEIKEVGYKVTPTIDSNGELLCMVFFVADEMGESKSSVGIRFGVPIYAAVGGTEVVEAEITEFTTSYDAKKNILGGSLLVNNKGNVHIRPYINVEIMDNNGQKIGSCNVQFGQPVQKGQTGPFVFREKRVLGPGSYKALVKVDYGRLYGIEKVATKEMEFAVEPPVESNSSEEEKKDE